MTKSFTQFIGESKDDWTNWPARDILLDKQCLIIEEVLGTRPRFIHNQKDSKEFLLLQKLIWVTRNSSRTSGQSADISIHEITDILNLIVIRPTLLGSTDLWILAREEDFDILNKVDGNLEQFAIEKLFKDF